MEAESDLQIHLLSKVLLEDLETEQIQLGCPHWAPRLHPLVMVVCVHLGHRQLIPSANTGTPGATGQSQHVVLQNFFQSLISTNTRDFTANAAAASKSSADLRISETIEGDK